MRISSRTGPRRGRSSGCGIRRVAAGRERRELPGRREPTEADHEQRQRRVADGEELGNVPRRVPAQPVVRGERPHEVRRARRDRARKTPARTAAWRVCTCGSHSQAWSDGSTKTSANGFVAARGAPRLRARAARRCDLRAALPAGRAVAAGAGACDEPARARQRTRARSSAPTGPADGARGTAHARRRLPQKPSAPKTRKTAPDPGPEAEPAAIAP